MAINNMLCGWLGGLIVQLVSTIYVGHFYSFPCLDYQDASLLVMIGEYAMTWLSHVESYVFVAVSQGCVQIAIFLVHSACGPTAPHVLKAAQALQVNVVA